MKLIVPDTATVQTRKPQLIAAMRGCMIYCLFLLTFLMNTTTAISQERSVVFGSASQSGSYTWTAPCGVTSVTVYVWGAGGAGGGANNSNQNGGGGGGGAFSMSTVTVVPGTTYDISIGQGGTGDLNNGGSGQASSFGTGATLVSANGGGGGERGNPGNGGIRGTGGTGTFVRLGGNGANGSSTGGGGGGSSATVHSSYGYGLNGVNATNSTGAAFDPTGLNGGNGGNGRSGSSNDGFNGSWPGGGGGGARRTSSPNRNGGDGANGRVEIRYNGVPSAYCYVDFNNSEPITYVNFAGINNSTSNATSPADGDSYQNFCTSAAVNQGATYPISIKGNTDGNFLNYVTVFIDWNQDGSLNGANEIYKVGTLLNTNGTDSYTINANILVPANAELGKTQMRVYKYYRSSSLVYNAANFETDACNSSWSYGQVEDYIVNVSGSCQQPTGATANNTATTITVCVGTPVTLRQTGGAIGNDQQWEWTKGTCTAGYENRNTNADAAYTFTPGGPGSTTWLVKGIGTTCGTSGPCQQVTVNVVAAGTIAVNSGYSADFTACRNVANPIFARFTVGGGATSAAISALPAGMTGSYNTGTKMFTISGTPTAAIGTYNYTITLSGNSPCTNPSLTGTITINDKATVAYTSALYCIGGLITPNTPVVTTGGSTTTFAIAPFPAVSATQFLPAGLSLDPATGIISGTPTGPAGAFSYRIRATNGCGTTDGAAFTLTISAGNTVFDMLPSGTQTICSSSAGLAIALDNSVTGVDYRLYRNGIAIGTTVTGNGNPIIFPNQTIAGTYTIVALTGCPTNMNGSLVLNVTPQPTATFTYSASSYCKSGTATASITGTTAAGATFSSTPAGLIFADATTGTIDLAASNPGIYTISYNAPASGGCAAYSYTLPTAITIVSSPNVYDVTGGGAYCAGTGGLPIGLNGSQLSVQYQLYIDGNPTGTPIAGTGAPISFGNQAAIGYYTVVAVLGGCTKQMDGDADIEINPAPADISVSPQTATLCQGSILPLKAALNPASLTTTSYSINSGASNMNLVIPGNSTTGVSHLLKVTGIPAGATINYVSINFFIDHNNVGDLRVNLKGPNGNVLNIVNRRGGTADDFGTTSTGTTVSSNGTVNIGTIVTGSAPFNSVNYLPEAAGGAQGATLVSSNLSNVTGFSGLYDGSSASANGNWILSVRDEPGSSATSGELEKWSITINYSVVNNPTSVTWSPVTDLYTDPAGTSAYIAGTDAATVYFKPSAAGTIPVVATASNAFGCEVSKTATLTVNPSPVITVTADYCNTGGTAGTVRINAVSDISVSSWLWNTGVNTGTSTTSYIEVNTAGNYFVSAVAAGNTCAGTGVMSIAQELVTNGDFELGNTGFTSDYTYYPDLPDVNNELVPDGGTDGYGVGIDGQNYHNYFFGYDHTYGTGTGNFMLVNGHGSELVIWKNENVTVIPNTEYYFSAWGLSLNDAGNNAELQFRINGTNVGTTAALPAGSVSSSSANNGWVKFYGTWNSGSATTADIYVVNLQNAAGGNDFGLDDISFGTLSTFFAVNPTSGSVTQTGLCAGSPINDIFFEVGGDGNAPNLSSGSLPAGLTTYWNGRTFRISGSPTSPGTYNFGYTTTGCNPRTQNISLTVIPASNSGNLAGGATAVSACYNTAGTVSLSGTTGGLQWQKSADGLTWSNKMPNNGTYTAADAMSASYYRVIAQNTAGCLKDTSQVVKVGIRNLWTGKTNDDWNLGSNWSDDNTPTVSPCNTVLIPNVAPAKPFPVLTGTTATVANIDIKAGATVTLLNDAVLKISGAITNANVSGGINANDGTIEMNGTTQSLSGSAFVGRNIEQLKVSGGTLNISAAANDTLNILQKLAFGNSTADLNTNDNITLKSRNAGTASIGVLSTGNVITGKFVIERYIKYWQNWELISAPIRDASVTVRNSWQEGGSPLASTGYGMQVTAPGGANGLDNSSSAPNLKWWNAAPGQGWQNITNTNSTAVNNKNGFYAYIRGDRSYGPSTPLTSGSTTTLRAKGTVYDANNPAPGVSVTANAANGFMIQVGNPLASTINFDNVYNHSTGIKPVYQLWDPTRNGGYGAGIYQAFTRVTGWRPTPSGGGLYATGTPNTAIQSGQAFFVEASVTTGSNISFVENDKMDGSRTATRNPVDEIVMMSTMLHGTNGEVADGNRVAYDASYNNGIGDEDANKITASGENFSVITAGKLLIVEGRKPIVINDTIFYNMTNLRTQAYKLSFEPMNLQDPLLTAELVDRFTNTRTPVSLTDSTWYDFTVTNVAASKAANRFILVFKRTAVVVLPVNFVSVSARRQADRTIAINWSVANEINIIRYEVERSANGTNFTGIMTIDANGSTGYGKTDLSPLAADNFYRIRAIGLGNEVIYSSIVKVAPLTAHANMAVYPNPVLNKQMNVVFTGQAKGSYTLQLTNMRGQVVYNGTVKVNTDNFNRQVSLNPALAGGSYQLNIISPDGSIKTIQVLIQ